MQTFAETWVPTTLLYVKVPRITVVIQRGGEEGGGGGGGEGGALIIKILQVWMSWQMQSGRCCCSGGSAPQQF